MSAKVDGNLTYQKVIPQSYAKHFYKPNGPYNWLRTPLRQVVSYGIRHVSIVIHCTVSHSSMNDNENMPYLV